MRKVRKGAGRGHAVGRRAVRVTRGLLMHTPGRAEAAHEQDCIRFSDSRVQDCDRGAGASKQRDCTAREFAACNMHIGNAGRAQDKEVNMRACVRTYSTEILLMFNAAGAQNLAALALAARPGVLTTITWPGFK